MYDILFRKLTIFAIMGLFIGTCIVPGISENIQKNDIESVGVKITRGVDQTNDVTVSFSKDVDWWPMFHHDLGHIGYSASKAPDTKYIEWSYTTSLDLKSSPAIADGKVYIGSDDKNVYCLDADNGNKIWSYTTSGEVDSSPAIADGKVYVGSWDKNVYCLDMDNGSEIWRYETIYHVRSSPAIADGKVYIGSGDYNVYCLNATTGGKLWTYRTDYHVRSSPAIADGKVYIGSGDYNVYCLDADNGNKIWSYTTSGKVDSSPAVADGKVYIGSGDYNVYCLDMNDGSEIWKHATSGKIHSSPAVADGKVYIGSRDDRIYCLNATTGSELWDYKTGSSVYSSPAIADGKVYIGSWDDTVYCFGGGNKPPIANFTYNPLHPHSLEVVQFSDTSVDADGFIESWYWDFGDGNISNNQHPTHQYSDNGTYVVTLNVTDDEGYKDSTSNNINIINVPPVVLNDSASTAIDIPVDINITDNDYDIDGSVDVTSVAIDSDVSHGNTDVNLSTGMVTYTPDSGYIGADNFTYTVKDDDGATSNVAIVNITVSALVPPDAEFSFSPSNPSTADIITFTDESTDIDGNIMSWEWNFGDGISISSDQNPSYQYNDDGTYIVNLTVTDNDGGTDCIEHNVIVSNVPPVAVNDSTSTIEDTSIDINITDNDYDIDGSVDVTSVAIGSDVSHGNTDVNLSTGIVTYTPDSGYIGADNFTYTVKDDDGAVSNTAIVNITVSALVPPDAEFYFIPSSPSTADTIQFTDRSSDKDGTIVSWNWNFGDGTGSSTDRNPTYSYSSDGTYSVTLNVTDNDGLTDAATRTITIKNKEPVITIKITFPAKDSVVNGTITIAGIATADGTIQRVYVKIGSGSWVIASGTESWSYEWDTGSVGNGRYTIYAKSYDGTNYSNIDSVDVTVNNPTPPVNQIPIIIISYPHNLDVISSTITITGTASDNDGVIKNVEIKIDSGSWASASGTESWSYNWNTTNLINGNHIISARSYDGSDYSSTEKIIVIVQNDQGADTGDDSGIGSEKSTDQNSPSNSALILFVSLASIITMIGILSIVYIIRIKTPK